LNDKLTGLATQPKRKKHLRQVLRAMEKLLLVRIVNFPGGEPDASPPDEEVLGKNSLISLTWTGMLWLRRAWSARERLSRNCDVVTVHQNLVDEEEDGGWGDPYWVDTGCRVSPDSDQGQALQVVDAFPAVSSIFDLAKLTGSCAEIAITTPIAYSLRLRCARSHHDLPREDALRLLIEIAHLKRLDRQRTAGVTIALSKVDAVHMRASAGVRVGSHDACEFNERVDAGSNRVRVEA